MLQDDTTVRNADAMAREVREVTPEMTAAWVAYEPPGQFKETMSFARYNGHMRCAFMAGYAAATGVEVDFEALGEALFALSAQLKDSGFLDDTANRPAYERVVAAFTALTPTETGEQGR